jgi:dolichyldiphosphatase
MRKAISLTHVEYESGSLLQMILAYISLLPVFSAISYLALILFRRDVATISMFLGQLLTESINKVKSPFISYDEILKETFQQPRPNASPMAGFGMPSSHTQWAFYLSTYATLYISSSRITLSYPLKLFLIVGLKSASILVGVSRIALKYHSVDQVIWGALVGTSFAIVWYLFDPVSRMSWVCETKVGKMLLMRDTSRVVGLMEKEYRLAVDQKNK